MKEITLIVLLAVSMVGTTRAHRTYTTSFPLAESPISERGNWEGGKPSASIGATLPPLRPCLGLESGTQGYDDATALLTGNWGPDQTVQATVHSVNQSDKFYEEVELRLRSSLSAHRATGYEVLFRCSKTNDAYAEIVRWNGPLGDFTYIDRHKGARFGVTEGDVVRATIVGNIITAYINGVPVARAADRTYATGRPGMGFFLQGTTGVNRDYGFTSFTASDGEHVSGSVEDRRAARLLDRLRLHQFRARQVRVVEIELPLAVASDLRAFGRSQAAAQHRLVAVPARSARPSAMWFITPSVRALGFFTFSMYSNQSRAVRHAHVHPVGPLVRHAAVPELAESEDVAVQGIERRAVRDRRAHVDDPLRHARWPAGTSRNSASAASPAGTERTRHRDRPGP